MTLPLPLLTAPTEASDPRAASQRQWTLTIHAPAASRSGKAWWLTLNNRPSDHHAVYRCSNAWKLATLNAAIVADIATYDGRPRVTLQRARLDIQFRFPARKTGGTRRDLSTNWGPTWKPIVDMLTRDTARIPKIRSLGIIPDDAPRYLCCQDCPHVTIGAPIPVGPTQPLGLVIVTITELPAVTHG